MSNQDKMQQELEQLRAENERLKKAQAKPLTCKVSQKGAVSVYGLGRFPVTLYKEQWIKLINFFDSIKQFIADNDADLAKK